VWEIDEGHTKFLHAMKIEPPKDLGSIGHPGSIHFAYSVYLTLSKHLTSRANFLEMYGK
jgi:hypothetical protein